MGLSNSQYQEIMRSYDQTRLTHLRERDERIEAIYKAVPQMRSMDTGIGSLANSKAKALLMGDGTALAELKSQMAAIREKRTEMLLAAGFAPDAMTLTYDCPLCKDTGYLDGVKCRCFRQKEIALLYKQSNLTDILTQENFETFTDQWFSSQIKDRKLSPRENIQRIRRICDQMVAEFPTNRQSLLLTGPTGTGKTFMTHCIAKALMDQCYSVVYLSAAALFDIFSDHQFQEEAPETELMYRHIYDCDLLIIDDLGTEFSNNFTLSKLFSCINERDRRGGAMVISTNLNLGEISSHYSERISSRLISGCKILEFFGEDVRIRKAIAGA